MDYGGPLTGPASRMTAKERARKVPSNLVIMEDSHSIVSTETLNLVNADPDPGQKITKFISNHQLKVKEKKNIFNSVPKP